MIPGDFETITPTIQAGYQLIAVAEDAPVYLALKDGKPFIIKQSRDEPPKYDIDEIRREYDALMSLEHPNIVRPTEWITEDHHGFATPYCGETLENYLYNDYKQYRDQKPRMLARCKILQGIAEAIAYLHSKGILHNDIKESNIAITPEGRAVLFDFGSAHTQETKPKTTLLTMEYAAPELFGLEVLVKDSHGKPALRVEEIINHKPATKASDVFSYAMVAHDTLTNEPAYLFNSITHRLCYHQPNIKHEELQRFAGLGQLVIAGLELQPKNRPTIKEFVKFFTKRRSTSGRLQNVMSAILSRAPSNA